MSALMADEKPKEAAAGGSDMSEGGRKRIQEVHGVT
jgi:hypothetical protein